MRETHPSTRPSALFRIGLVLVSGLLSLAVPIETYAQGVEAESPAEGEETTDSAKQESAWLGVQVGEGSKKEGAPVVRVIDDSPAARAELRSGDRILAVQSESVHDLSSLRSALSDYGPGAEIDIMIRREGEEKTLTAVLSARPTQKELLDKQLVGRELPTFELAPVAGEKNRVTNEDLAGKPLVLEFWATWCYPCRKTSKTLRKLKTELGDEVRIVGISDEDQRRLRKYLDEKEVPYSIAKDIDRSAHDGFYISSYPTVVVADAEGEVVEIFLGIGHEAELRKTLDDLTE